MDTFALTPKPETAAPPLPITCRAFAEPGGEESNVLRTAIATAARDAGFEGEFASWDWLDDQPMDGLIADIITAMHKHGYQIAKHCFP